MDPNLGFADVWVHGANVGLVWVALTRSEILRALAPSPQVLRRSGGSFFFFFFNTLCFYYYAFSAVTAQGLGPLIEGYLRFS